MDPRYDVYTSKCDRKNIVEFIKEVERYPCLYDKTHPEYANKYHNRKAWVTIAKKANTTIPDCRDKWRKIRISFMRSLKQQFSDKPPMRPYYLTDELHFLKPFIKVGPKECSQSPKERIEAMEFETVKKQVISEDEISDSRDDYEESHHEINNITFTENIIPKILNGHVQNGNQVKTNGVKHEYSDDIDRSPRKMFLMSIFPEVQTFTEQEMRIFRRQVIDVVDGIINKRI